MRPKCVFGGAVVREFCATVAMLVLEQVPKKIAYGAQQGSIRCCMFPREHTVPNK